MTQMTDEEIEKELSAADEIDSYEYRNPESEDDYIVAFLYETKAGRIFRYVESSGMDSSFAGAGNVGEWLTKAEEKNWKEF
jgi:hypothetical protein